MENQKPQYTQNANNLSALDYINNNIFVNNISPDFNMYSKRKDHFTSKEQEQSILLKKEQFAMRAQRIQAMKD